jgi:hypothetical protein
MGGCDAVSLIANGRLSLPIVPGEIVQSLRTN